MNWLFKKTPMEENANNLIAEIDVYLESMENTVNKEYYGDYITLINDNIDNIDKIVNELSTTQPNSNLIARLTEQKESLKSYLPKFGSGNGNTKKKINKKVILGKERCIYTKLGDRKEYLKYKGRLITVKDYKKIKTGLIR
jgi:hypothetical protein